MITCTPQALVDAAICYTKMSKEDLTAAEIYLLCEWASAEPTGECPQCVNTGPAWILTPGIYFVGDLIGVFTPLTIPPGPPFDPDGVCLYWGTTAGGPYPNKLWVPLADVGDPFSLLSPPLSSHFTPGITYYFITQASTQSGYCSNFSAEVSHVFTLPPYGPAVQWTPKTEVASWVDSGGPHVGDWNTFNTTANIPTVTQLTFSGSGNLTSITGLPWLAALVSLDVNTNSIPSLDLLGMVNLTTVNCSANASLTTLTLTGCTALTTLNCSGCDITGTLDVSPSGASLITLISNDNSNLTALTLTGCVNLAILQSDNCSITSVTLPGTLFSTLYLRGNSGLTMPSLVGQTVLNDIDFRSEGWNQAEVDACLCAVDAMAAASAILTGDVDVSFNVPPGAIGAACKSDLQTSWSWVVTTD